MPDPQSVAVVTGVNRGLFGVLLVEKVVRQAEVPQWRGFPSAGCDRRQDSSLRLVAFGDDDLFTSLGPLEEFREVGAGLGDLVCGRRYESTPASVQAALS